jgi:hypothetical protein
VGGGGDGVTLQHTVDARKVRHQPKRVKSEGGGAHREGRRWCDGSKSDVPNGRFRQGSGHMASGCDGGFDGCPVSMIFARTKEAMWRSAQQLPHAKTEGEMGE